MDLNTIDVFINLTYLLKLWIWHDLQPLSFVFLTLLRNPRETVDRDYLID